jgi:hypothetical protein
MPRHALGPRLRWDKSRKTWVIRDGAKFIRVGGDQEQAALKLDAYKESLKPRGEMWGLVYVVGFGPYVKIGFTATRLWKRVSDLKIAMPEKPIVYGYFVGTMRSERETHKRFAEQRLNGEWFKNEGPVKAWIEGGCQSVSVHICALSEPDMAEKRANILARLVKKDGYDFLQYRSERDADG